MERIYSSITDSVNMDSQWSKQEGFFCTCDSGVARCQSQHQCHFRRINLMFEAYCMGKCAWQLSIKCMSFMGLSTVAKI